ncbi:MAG TPA: divalent-cation tolerance protein CutA [Candidatus Kapabacteria bacterium]|nr:divalent-cation tolerance protein CutA [Candidatus Kapabacteria bacterium]
MPAIVLFVNCANAHEAHTIARKLVEERHAACCTIVGGVESYYIWEERMERGEEVMIMIKTTDERFADAERCIRELHGYDVPEIIALPVTQGSQQYLAWLEGSVSR